MEREELLDTLRVLAARAQESSDKQVVHASIVLFSLMAALLTSMTPELSKSATEFSDKQLKEAQARNQG